MMANQVALIRREFWEHRAIYITPVVIALIVTLMTMATQIVASGFDEAVDLALLGASNVGEAERRVIVTMFLIGLNVNFVIAMWILTIFYCLDSLYAERKDKSILFWRSLPLTDAETVVSKLITALLVIPLVTLAVLIVTHLVNLVLASIWLTIEGADAGFMIWNLSTLFDVWSSTLIFLLAAPLWLSPFVGWFLFVSAWTKRSPFLVAFLPIVVLPLLEVSIFRTSFVSEALFERSVKIPLFSGSDVATLFDEDNFRVIRDVSVLSMVDLGKFLLSPGLWLGFVVCGLFTTAAIYMRRYRDES